MKDGTDASTSPSASADGINVEALRSLVDLMAEHDLVELEYELGDLAIRLSKRQTGPAARVDAPTASAGGNPAPQPVAAAPQAAEASEDDKYLKIVSPMVGSFYVAASRDAEPYVSVGSEVDADTVVCLIEAMKVFNEIKAEVSGRIARVCVANEETIEFGQTLFLVEPL